MVQQMNTASEHASTLRLSDGVSVDSADLESLSSRYSALSQDVARLHQLLEDLTQRVASPRAQSRASSKRASRNLSRRLDTHRNASAARAERGIPGHGGPMSRVNSKLKRACLIALMEASEPVSAETLYDRIARRGSFKFTGYKHPLRAIVLAMGAMVRQGQALLHNDGGLRRWRWDPKNTA
jgi:chromosome segregation ATPase